MKNIDKVTQSILDYINTYGETKFSVEEIKNHLISLENEGLISITGEI